MSITIAGAHTLSVFFDVLLQSSLGVEVALILLGQCLKGVGQVLEPWDVNLAEPIALLNNFFNLFIAEICDLKLTVLVELNHNCFISLNLVA